MKWNYHRDKNEKDIIDAAWKLGWCGFRIQQAYPPGAPDLVLAKGQRVLLVEVKSKSGRRSESQMAMGTQFPIHVVRSVDDLVEILDAQNTRG